MKRIRLSSYLFDTHNAAFTLVELMVVIAIIALLATLVFSGYGAARAQGLAAAAVANFRKVSVAEQLFTADWNGFINGTGNTHFPPAGNNQAGASWRVTPYLVDVPWRSVRWEPHVMPAWRPLWDRALPYEIIWGGHDPKGYRYAVSYNHEFTLEPWASQPLETDTRFKRMFNYSRPQTTIHFVTGVWRFEESHAADPSLLPLPTSGTNPIYFPHNQRTVATFLDGRVELLRHPIPPHLVNPERPLPN